MYARMRARTRAPLASTLDVKLTAAARRSRKHCRSVQGSVAYPLPLLFHIHTLYAHSSPRSLLPPSLSRYIYTEHTYFVVAHLYIFRPDDLAISIRSDAARYFIIAFATRPATLSFFFSFLFVYHFASCLYLYLIPHLYDVYATRLTDAASVCIRFTHFR